jgi:hypothetical protein
VEEPGLEPRTLGPTSYVFTAQLRWFSQGGIAGSHWWSFHQWLQGPWKPGHPPYPSLAMGLSATDLEILAWSFGLRDQIELLTAHLIWKTEQIKLL